MLTVKRKVDTEEDRYGGFEVSTDKSFGTGYDLEINQSYSTAQTVKGETLSYSPRQEIRKPENPASAKKPLRAEEVMPGIIKPKMNENAERMMELKQKMETKTKALLAIYMLVVIALAAIVIATGIAINAANSRVVALNNQIAASNEKIIEQNANLEILDSENYIKGSAYENGMVEAQNPIEIELLPVEEATSYQSSTNWFDKICDFLSNIFGG